MIHVVDYYPTYNVQFSDCGGVLKIQPGTAGVHLGTPLARHATMVAKYVAMWQRHPSFSLFSLHHIRCWIRAWGQYLNSLIPSTGVISTLVNATCIYAN